MHDTVVEVREVFDFQAKVEATKGLLTQRKEGAIEIGRNLRAAKKAGQLREFCDALGILTVTAEGFIFQADIADGLCVARQKKVTPVPRYTAKEILDMLDEADSLEDVRSFVSGLV